MLSAKISRKKFLFNYSILFKKTETNNHKSQQTNIHSSLFFITNRTGTIEEKVYQRQVTKKALEKSVVEGDVDAVPSFSNSELRDLFKLRENTICGKKKRKKEKEKEITCC